MIELRCDDMTVLHVSELSLQMSQHDNQKQERDTDRGPIFLLINI